jgi:uncharacterized protein YbcI
MDPSNESMAEKIARAASHFEKQRTGKEPKSVHVTQSDGTLVITVHGALSPAEQDLAKSAEGAEQVQHFHRQLFATTSGSLRQDIKKITGVEVREAAAEVEPASGAVVTVFATGTIVQVYLLARSIPDAAWHGGDDVKR